MKIQHFFAGLFNSILVVAITIGLVGCLAPNAVAKTKDTYEDATDIVGQTQTDISIDVNGNDLGISKNLTGLFAKNDSDKAEIYFFDVGQGDCTLIKNNDEAVLIDTGSSDYCDTVINYLDVLGVNRINMLILTHPDADHIQNADEILLRYDVKNVVMPDAKKETKSFEILEETIAKTNVNVIVPASTMSTDLCSGRISIYTPKDGVEYEDTNSYSLITTYAKGANSFVFLGDATGEEINDIGIAFKGFSVVKLAHHGSANCGCNSEELMRQLNPRYAVISCGYKNDYGHPHRETMAYLQNNGISVFRTDMQGTISCKVSDGISWSKTPSDEYTCGSDM